MKGLIVFFACSLISWTSARADKTDAPTEYKVSTGDKFEVVADGHLTGFEFQRDAEDTLRAISAGNHTMDAVKNAKRKTKQFEVRKSDQIVVANESFLEGEDKTEITDRFPCVECDIVRGGKTIEWCFVIGDTLPDPKRKLKKIVDGAKQRAEAAKQAEEARKAAVERDKARAAERAIVIEAAKWRMWTDSSGNKHKAKFGGIISGSVKLIRGDGSVVKIPLDDLSDEDREPTINDTTRLTTIHTRLPEGHVNGTQVSAVVLNPGRALLPLLVFFRTLFEVFKQLLLSFHTPPATEARNNLRRYVGSRLLKAHVVEDVC
jgi:hypothetical protein